MKMQADDPPYLSVGTAVSAKYKGAFCEAKVSKVVRIVKCKVNYKMGLGTATVSDEQIKGTLRVGQVVQVKHPERKELVEATITKIQDCSQYTVVFDDGDITTLRRSALCLKSGRHFNESETLDQLPLTHPEHFSNPVVGGRRGRRNRLLKEDSSDGEPEEENEPDLEGYSMDIGRVVSVEATDKKRNKDNWFPGLVVIPSAQPTVRINVKDEYLVRSFKDGRYYTVPKKEVTDFNRDMADKVESSVLSEAVTKALKYLDNNELPVHWERSSLFNTQSTDSDSDENFSDSSDDEPCEEKDRFVAQLYKFMDDAGTPLNKSPAIGNKDVDLYRLFSVVQKLGGYNKVTNQGKWRSVTIRLKFPNNQNTTNQVKMVYKKCLSSYETFYRTLGVTMLNHTRSNKKNKGRSLIRDRDRATPVNSPRPDKDEEDKKEEEKVVEDKPRRRIERKDDDKKKKELIENSDTSSSEAMDSTETPSTSKILPRSKRIEARMNIEKKLVKPATGEKVRALVEKFEEQTKKEEEDKVQQTRSKTSSAQKSKDVPSPEKKEIKPTPKESLTKMPIVKITKKLTEEEKKRGKKRSVNEDKNSSDSSTAEVSSNNAINIGDKLKVYYGPTNESKVTYEAKVVEIDRDASGPVYLVHYTGWNTRYDEWIGPARIAENLSATTKAKKLKQSPPGSKLIVNQNKAIKRGRGMSITGRSTIPDTPRSTTPSSITSTSSRTKSPATPVNKAGGSRVLTRLDSNKRSRRTSGQTDISVQSDSESEVSESEPELTRTRSGSKSEEGELKTYRRRPIRTVPVPKTPKSKEKDDDDTEKEEEIPSAERPKRTRKVKKSPEKSTEESDDDLLSPPKGRDFDLNQIRSELKGFTKAIKTPPMDAGEKEALSSSEESLSINIKTEDDESQSKEEQPAEQSASSEDIYEFKEPEPFEFESRSKLVDEKGTKKRIPRIFEDLEKSPKRKLMKSPSGKSNTSSPDVERSRFRRTSLRRTDDSDEDDDRKEEDPFDKLVESPSFNMGKCSEKMVENKEQVTKNLLEEPLSLFRELPETMDEYSRDMELSDTESQTQPIFSRSDEIFTETFTKSSIPDQSSLDMEFSVKSDEPKQKDSDDDESIRASIQRVIAQTSSTDDESNDELLITPSTTNYLTKKKETEKPVFLGSNQSLTSEEPNPVVTEVNLIDSSSDNAKSSFPPIKQISPALQETDSSILESICSQPVLLNTTLEDTKDLNVKVGTKIADSILQKLNSIKNKTENDTPKTELKPEVVDDKTEVKEESNFDLLNDVVNMKTTEFKPNVFDTNIKSPPETKKQEIKLKKSTPTKYEGSSPESKKRRKVLSRAYVESDTDSSDSEQLIIARSDEDSQTFSLDNKADIKESDSNLSVANLLTTDDSQTQEEERNFKFEEIENQSPVPAEESSQQTTDVKEEEEEPDSHLHSLLLCEETIPRSPAPPTETPSVSEPAKTKKNDLEMPFASAPGSSNSKSMLLGSEQLKPKPQPPPLVLPVENQSKDNTDASAVMDNTPPTTPESTISNLSPRGDNGGLSPNTADNESCKSNDGENEDLRERRRNSLKMSPYSEDDSQMTNESNAMKKIREDSNPAPCRKRRRSCRGSEDSQLPPKRGRKTVNRSRHNSDSDDTSEHSLIGSNITPNYERTIRSSPRPSKYNFFVEFDPGLDSAQRIAVLQEKLSDLRKTYADVKAELAAVERRRKKIRRREREAMKATKQEMACA